MSMAAMVESMRLEQPVAKTVERVADVGCQTPGLLSRVLSGAFQLSALDQLESSPGGTALELQSVSPAAITTVECNNDEEDAEEQDMLDMGAPLPKRLRAADSIPIVLAGALPTTTVLVETGVTPTEMESSAFVDSAARLPLATSANQSPPPPLMEVAKSPTEVVITIADPNDDAEMEAVGEVDDDKDDPVRDFGNVSFRGNLHSLNFLRTSGNGRAAQSTWRFCLTTLTWIDQLPDVLRSGRIFLKFETSFDVRRIFCPGPKTLAIRRSFVYTNMHCATCIPC